MKSFAILFALTLFATGCTKDSETQSKNNQKNSSTASSDKDDALKSVFGNMESKRLK